MECDGDVVNFKLNDVDFISEDYCEFSNASMEEIFVVETYLTRQKSWKMASLGKKMRKWLLIRS